MIRPSATVAEERFRNDKRQIAGMLVLFSVGTLIFPQANLASLIGPDGWPDDAIPRTSLVASVFVIAMGVMGLAVALLQLVCDYGHQYLTGAFLAVIQLAWVPYLTDLTDVGMTASDGVGFIPDAYQPSVADVRFVGAMGMLGILGYGFAFLGSLGFSAFALYSFQVGKPGDRSGSYYRGRLLAFAVALFVAGISQTLLGIYILSSFGQGPLPNGAIGVAMYFVNFPEISVFVGLVQILNSLFAVCRYFGAFGCDGRDNHWFLVTSFLQWLCMQSLQILTQVSYAPGGVAAAAAPSQTAMFLGLAFLPAFLDYKMRTTPDELPEGYYDIVVDGADSPDGKVAAGLTAAADGQDHSDDVEEGAN